MFVVWGNMWCSLVWGVVAWADVLTVYSEAMQATGCTFMRAALVISLILPSHFIAVVWSDETAVWCDIIWDRVSVCSRWPICKLGYTLPRIRCYDYFCTAGNAFNTVFAFQQSCNQQLPTAFPFNVSTLPPT